MTDVNAHVDIDLSGLIKFDRAIKRQLQGSGHGHIRDAIKKWGLRYRSWAQERFDTSSKGGGKWPPLKPSTIRRRRTGKRQGKYGATSILRDTGVLFKVLTPTFQGTPGSIEEDIPFGIRVGYGGPSKHPNGSVTVADIASFHQKGAGFLPERKIIVDPIDKVVDQMGRDMVIGIQRELNDHDDV